MLVNFRLEEGLVKALDDLARKKNRTRSAQIREMIMEGARAEGLDVVGSLQLEEPISTRI